MDFFSRFPRFLETTGTRRLPNRLAQRHKLIIAANSDLLKGARVLDIASHDGRWSMAALDAGASHVVGVEGRRELVERSLSTFRHYAVPESRYEFVTADARDYVRSAGAGRYDVVLCLGFLYHILDHMDFIVNLAALRPRAVVLDTGVSVSNDPVIEVGLDERNDFRNSIGDDGIASQLVPVGRASRPALRMMLSYVGWEARELDAAAWIDDWAECEQYRDRRRATFLVGPPPVVNSRS